jgi:hypothetical protein
MGSARSHRQERRVGGSFVGGGGYNIDKHNSIVGQFMRDCLPPSVGAIAQLNFIS